MTRFTLIALKMALPSATSVCQDVRHTRAHYLSHTSGRNTHLQDSQRPQRSISRLVPWGYSVQSGGLASVSGRGKTKIRAERKTTAEQRKSGRQVCKHLDVLCNVSKTSLEWKKKKSSVCDILSEKMEYLLNRFNISAHTCRTFYSLGISPHPMQTLVQNILHSVYWGIRCVFALMQICQMSLKSHEIICLVQGAS